MSANTDLNSPLWADASDEAYQARWRFAARRSVWLWSMGYPCPSCGEWVGHFGGAAGRPPCELIPMNVPLEEVRPNLFTVRRHWIGDAIRKACKS